MLSDPQGKEREKERSEVGRKMGDKASHLRSGNKTTLLMLAQLNFDIHPSPPTLAIVLNQR